MRLYMPILILKANEMAIIPLQGTLTLGRIYRDTDFTKVGNM